MSGIRYYFFACAAVAPLAGCAIAPPPLSSASPASPAAEEGTRTARQSSLRADELKLMRRTAAQLAAAHQEQQHWDAYGPVSGNPEEAAKDNPQPETKHDQH